MVASAVGKRVIETDRHCRNCASVKAVAENLEMGRGGGGGQGGWSPPLRIGMNIHSMKLFNNLIKNALLAPMFCGLVKS